MSKRFVTAVLLISLIVLGLPHVVSAASPRLLITEIKLGGGSEPKEFVEIFNDSDVPVNLDGFQIEYAKSSFASTKCSDPNWKTAATSSSQVNLKTLTGSLGAQEFLVIEISLTDNASGSVRLSANQDDNFLNYDFVGWGSEASCFIGRPAPIPLNGMSIKRTFDELRHPIKHLDNDNGLDFKIHTQPNPGTDECLETDCYSAEELPPDENNEQTPDPIAYLPIKITELLPNPGSPKLDDQDEFIEVYNPNPEILNLEGYKLGTTSGMAVYEKVLPEIILQPGEFKALYSSLTGLSLVNSKAGNVWISSPDGEVLSEITPYPANMKDDISWALINELWQITNTATPGQPNQANADPLAELQDSETETCPEGKYLNQETNRCRNIVAVTSPTPCKQGQIRSPETNRCRNIAAAATVTPCLPGQERNPTTKRCRNIATGSTSSQCQTGYERNPDTNRCRKVNSVTGAKTSKSFSDQEPESKLNYLLIIIGTTGLIAYGIYEYRQDIVNTYQKLRSRLKKGVA